MSYRSAVALTLEVENSQLFIYPQVKCFAVVCGTSNGLVSSTEEKRLYQLIREALGWKQPLLDKPERAAPAEGLWFGNLVREQLCSPRTKDVVGRELKALGLKSILGLCTDISAE